MKTVIFTGAFICFLLGVFYGFASSPDYGRILKYSIVFETLAIAGFAYCFFHTKGQFRIVVDLFGVVAICTLAQAIMRYPAF